MIKMKKALYSEILRIYVLRGLTHSINLKVDAD